MPGLFGQVRQVRRVIFPMLAVEGQNGKRRYGFFIQASNIDTESIRVRAGNVEWPAPAVFAEVVLRNARVERVNR